MIPLPKGSLYYFHRVMNLDHTPCAIGAKFSRNYLFRVFFIIGDDIVLLRMIRLVAPRAQRVGGLRGPHLTRHRSASSSVLLVEKKTNET